MKKYNLLFVGIIWLFLAACLVRAVLLPKDISAGENRYANKLAPPTPASYLDGSFQDSVEAALSDQAIGAEKARSGYNLLSSGIREAVLSGFFAANKDRYIRLSDSISVFGGDYLVYDTRPLENIAPELERKAGNINDFAAAHPDVPIYVYYIEKDTDINFETGEKTGAFEYLEDKLDIPEERIGAFRINGFDDYARRFYRTDHHWNSYGSYQGCDETLKLLDAGSALKPVGEVTLDKRLSGSKAIECGEKNLRSEEFRAYRFEYPPMNVTINGAAAGDYGAQEEFLRGDGGELTYGGFYGGDYGEVALDSGSGGENLLVIGESHDNAILKLLAANFGRVYAVDLRYYEAQMGTKFNAYDYIKNNDIDKVLLIGSIGFYLSDEIML